MQGISLPALRDSPIRGNCADPHTGAAATFGLPGVGNAALELERALQPVCASGGVPNDQDRGRIEDKIAQLLSVSPSRVHH
jgi:hypothetical protein